MTLKSIIATLGLGLTLGTAAPVFADQSKVFECVYTQKPNRGPVPATFTLTIKQDEQFALIEAVFTRQLHSYPVRARLAQLSKTKWRVKWQLVGLDYQGTESKVSGGIVDYSLSLNVLTGRFVMNGTTREYFPTVHGNGRCIPA
jgi:hypothetical protein